MSPPPNRLRVRASRSCGNCRAIKRRCDQQLPSCGQCIRLRQDCPGYRDEWELVFRDQTSHTIIRSKKKLAKKAASAAVTEVDSSPSPPYALTPSLDEIGVNFFLRNFVSGGYSPSRGYLTYIPTAYSRDAEHPTLVTSMAAVGLVALATQQPELASHARAKYSEAISHVNSALASPVEAVKDSTLMSVISLGVFEHVSNFESWVRHVKGAAALVVLRGKSQFSNPTAFQMFNQVRADMTAACIQRVQPFPDDLQELQEEATKHIGISSPFWLIGVLATRCATLFANVARNTRDIHASGFIPWDHYFREAIVLQEDFQDVRVLLDEQEPYITISEPGAGADFITYNGRYDLYQSSRSIRLWNNSRMVEIIVCEIACWLINKILTTDRAQPGQDQLKLRLKQQELLQVMSKRGEEVLASVPQGLGLTPLPGSPIFAGDHRPICISGGYMLTWNLYTVGKSPVVNDQTRQWVIKQLTGISKGAGIAMALQLAQDIKKIDLMSH